MADLSEHFSFEELTVTSNSGLQGLNRIVNSEQMEKLRLLALHCENIRELCGNSPVRIHSGYRSTEVNGIIPGSSSTSQHTRCEAVDFDIPGQTIEETFNSLLESARRGEFEFGQLIIEEADRDYAVVRWVHCSVIGTLDPEKVGQVLKMNAGPDGKPHYILMDQIKFNGGTK